MVVVWCAFPHAEGFKSANSSKLIQLVSKLRTKLDKDDTVPTAVAANTGPVSETDPSLQDLGLGSGTNALKRECNMYQINFREYF